MSSTTTEAQALAHTVGVYERTDLVTYRLQGDDQRTWLNGQLTCNVRELTAGSATYGLAVTVKGRIMADVWALDDGQQLLVLLPRTAEATITESFENQIIMEDVELLRDDKIRVLSIQGPQTTTVLSTVGRSGLQPFTADELGHGGAFLLLDDGDFAAVHEAVLVAASAQGGLAVSAEGYELARLRAGRPRFPNDFGEHSYPQEAGLKERAVSFNKGCYLGQEVICTIENRGKVPRALYRLSSDGPLQAGDDILNLEGKVVGKVTSAMVDPDAATSLGLGYLKRAQVDAQAELSSGEARVNVTEIVV